MALGFSHPKGGELPTSHQGLREPVQVPGYFIAPGMSEQSSFSLNRTFAGPCSGPPTPTTTPLDGPASHNRLVQSIL